MTATQFYLPRYFAAEHEFAALLTRLMRSGCQKIEPVTDGLGEKQPDAVLAACQNPVSILCGPPGTGKTTTLRRICDSYNKAGLSTCLMCPTAKGAKRGDEVINPGRDKEIACTTIHRGLEYDVRLTGFKRNFHNPLDVDALIIEEFSMLDILLGAGTMAAIDPKKTRVVFCGDWHQLPSVGPGAVARDMILSGVIPKTELDHIFRTGANSGIAFNAMRVLNGEPCVKVDPRTGETFKDFYFVPFANEEDSLGFILENVSKKIPTNRGYDPLTDIQVLSPGKKSKVGVDNLNQELRNILNPNKGAEFRGFREGDKVINRTNRYEHDIVNGDIGLIEEIHPDDVQLNFNNEELTFLKKDEFDGISLAYCNTIHTSQGSEYKAVIIPVHRTHYRLLFRELLYTGMTRARELAVIVGDPSAFERCIQNNVTDKRNTNLMPILRHMAQKTAA